MKPSRRAVLLLSPAFLPAILLVVSVADRRLSGSVLFPAAIAVCAAMLVHVALEAALWQPHGDAPLWAGAGLGAFLALLSLTHGEGFVAFDFLIAVAPVAALAAAAQWAGGRIGVMTQRAAGR